MKPYISLAHGDGGELAHKLIQEVFVEAFDHSDEARFDAAAIKVPSEKLAFSTDSFVIQPIFFPGGNIGKLAVAGTVNDLSVSGAVPLYLSVGFIIEEGFLLEDLKEIVQSMAIEAKKAGVHIVTGDTKVVERGSVDGLFINTAGIGYYNSYEPEPSRIEKGDSIIVNGTIGDHGLAVMSARDHLGIHHSVDSDCASLNHLIQAIVKEFASVRIMRDPTRGGVATTLVEICEDFHVHATIFEEHLPIKDEVDGACDILGFDPLYIANEGKVLFIVPSEIKEKVVDFLHQFEEGKDAAIIGEITQIEEEIGKLYVTTPLGTLRRLHRLSNLQLPRIC
ncbi:hydrogenase expression/formation protein HypE [Bacillaceae bacterium S4-13-56]